MSEVNKFAQPDAAAAAYLINFLDTADHYPDIIEYRRLFNQRLGLAPGGKFLEVGCGIGGAAIPVADISGPTGLVAGVDINPALLDVAIERAGQRPGIEFRLGNACAIPYPDHYFDAARCERVFLYLPDRLAAIREMMRVVKPGGRVHLIDADVPSAAIYSAKPALTQKMLQTVAASIPNPCSGRELPFLARKAGLRDLRIDTFASSFPHEFLISTMSGALYKAAETGVVPRSGVDEWLAEQAALNASGDFFQMWSLVMITGTV